MLALTRRFGESLILSGGNLTGGIVITVTRLRSDLVRLGITAPDDVQIHRDEVYVQYTGEPLPDCITPERRREIEQINSAVPIERKPPCKGVNSDEVND